MPAPLSYDAPDGDTLDVAIMRIRSAPPSSARTQLWYLAGGPGGAGTSLIGLLHKRYAASWPNADLYTIDHRGTGGTSRLSCPKQEAPESPGGIGIRPEEGAGCVEALQASQGPRLPHLNVSNSARDLERAMRAVETQGARVFIWGNSYGTYWAFRFLGLFPKAVDGAFLEALVPPNASYRSFDYWMNETGMKLMERCAKEPGCAAHFKGSPVDVARALPARLEAGHCSALSLPVRVSWFLGSMLYDHDLRGLLPLLVRLVDRCNEHDVARLRRIYGATFGNRGMLTAGDFSAPSYAHVVLSELWGGAPPGGESLDAVASTCLFCPGDRAEMDQGRSKWPTYPVEAPPEVNYKGPLWLLQGNLDPAIPPALPAALESKLRGPSQHYIAFPFGAHTLTGKTRAEPGDCALGLLTRFLADPTQAPETACVAKSPAPPLPDGPPGLAAALLGPGDAWSGE